MAHRCNMNDMKPGKILSRLSYILVKKIKNNNSLVVQNLDGEEWSIGKDIVMNECYGTEYAEEKEVSLTEMVDIMKGAGDKVFHVQFLKKDGTQRDMTAVLTGSDTNLGRSLVRELLVDTDGNLKEQERQIDHRTLHSLVLQNVLYSIKGKSKKKKSPENPEPKPKKKRKKKN